MYVMKKPGPRRLLLSDTALYPPNPRCYVCSEKPEVVVEVNTKTFVVKALEEKVQLMRAVKIEVRIRCHISAG